MFKKILVTIIAYLFVPLFLGITSCITIFFLESMGIEQNAWIYSAFLEALILALVGLFSLYHGRSDGKYGEFFKRVATKPNNHNYNWQGGRSFITIFILEAVMLLRATSCLQLCKQVYRGAINTGKDRKSSRPNVPPFFQEWYFIAWGFFLVFQVFTGFGSKIVWMFDLYFIIESFVWILYYAVFRRFFEENYSIYHVLEHLPLIFMMIPFQAMASSLVSSFEGKALDWKAVMVVLLGQAEKDQLTFSIIGFLYAAIVISMILSMFPSENVKRGNPDTVIIGYGDVVKNRLEIAFDKRQSVIDPNKRGKKKIYSLDSDKAENKEINSIFDLINGKRISNDVVAWICTPSDTHWYYLNILMSKADLIAVEKPLASDAEDLQKFQEFVQSESRKDVFFLSYYLLEKALPLTFLSRPRDFYIKYLWGELEGKENKTDKKISEAALSSLFDIYLNNIDSKVRSFTMTIKEYEDKRKLPESGQLIETFVHNCLVASLFTGLPGQWNDAVFKNKTNNKIVLNAVGKYGSKIELVMEKDAANKGNEEQTAELVFGNGCRIKADFKNKTAEFLDEAGTRQGRISVAEKYMGKYDVQCDMVYDCYANKLDPSDIDGLYNQIEVIEWLLNTRG